MKISRRWNLNTFHIKKQRGQWRKLDNLLKNIEQIAPFQNTLSPYEHFHVPSDEFIQHPQTGANVKTVFCRRWIEKTEQIIRTKPSQLPFCKIVALLSVPQFWSSQIIIFYSRSYYDSFWIRNGPEQFWKPIDNEKVSFMKNRNIITFLNEQGFREWILGDDGSVSMSTLWFYGDVPSRF